jgi:hypothetical protein
MRKALGWRMPDVAEIRERILANVEPEPNTGCWLWSAGMSGEGYGILRFGTPKKAHRVAYNAFIGEIPGRLFVCHRCDTPLCVNPDHLFLGTAADNAQDMVRKGRNGAQMKRHTHCKRGHEFTPANVYTYMRDGYEIRTCRTCLKDGNKKYVASRRPMRPMSRYTRELVERASAIAEDPMRHPESSLRDVLLGLVTAVHTYTVPRASVERALGEG